MIAVVLALAGCSAAPTKRDGADPLPSRVPVPAQAAGGSCQLLDYDEINTDVGIGFDVAAASQIDQTFTCVLEREGAPLPDLTFTITLVTDLDIPTFRSRVIPSGSTVIGDLGKIGYSRSLSPANGAGPGVEVGWLAGNQRLINFRLRLAAGTAAGDATALTPKLLTLARRIDLTSV